MNARLLWALVGVVFVFYAAFRLATMQARIDALTESVSRLEQSSVSGAGSSLEVVAAGDGGCFGVRAWGHSSRPGRWRWSSCEIASKRRPSP